jgi:hypothetical protein
MPELPDFLQTDNRVLWALILVGVAMVFTLEAVQSAIEGAWPHQRRPSTMLPHQRTAQSGWAIVAVATIAGGLLLITNLAIVLWQDLEHTDSQVLSGILLGAAWALFMSVSIERFGIRGYVTSIGVTAPIAALALLIVSITLLSLSLVEIWPPESAFRDALPIITIRHR